MAVEFSAYRWFPTKMVENFQFHQEPRNLETTTLKLTVRLKGKWMKRILLLLILSIAGAGVAHYGGFVDLSEYIDQINDLAGL